MALVLANNAITTLASGINDTATSISVSSATDFPSISGSQFFYVTIDDGTNIEIVKVTGVSGSTFTVVRAQDDTSAASFSTGVTVAIRITKLILKDNVTTTLGALAGQTIADSGNLTLDVAGQIKLDADGGFIVFEDGGTQFGYIENSSTDLVLGANTQDKDIIFKGNDGGSTITALTLDMSLGGSASFSHDIQMVDNGLLRMGAGGDLILTSDGTNGSIFANEGNLTLDTAGDIILDADGENIKFSDAGTEVGQIDLGSQNFTFRSQVDDKDIIFRGQDGTSEIVALTLDMSEAGAATFNNNVTAFSDERLKDNIETLEDGLDKVEQLRGVTYTRDNREEIGVIAQEVEKILPEIVLTADDEMGTKSVDYSRITAVLIEAVKELSARVKELESK